MVHFFLRIPVGPTRRSAPDADGTLTGAAGGGTDWLPGGNPMINMSNGSYEILDIKIKNTSDAIRGKDIYYKCNLCQTIIPSTPKDDAGCSCGNIGIDRDLIRLFVKDYSNFIILRKIG